MQWMTVRSPVILAAIGPIFQSYVSARLTQTALSHLHTSDPRMTDELCIDITAVPSDPQDKHKHLSSTQAAHFPPPACPAKREDK